MGCCGQRGAVVQLLALRNRTNREEYGSIGAGVVSLAAGVGAGLVVRW